MVISTESHEVENLRKFRELSADQTNHDVLLKDKKAILYAATLLENENKVILNLCLDVFENFVANKNTHLSLISVFGIYESLEALCIRVRNIDTGILKRASAITETLRNAAPPAYGTRSRVKASKSAKNQTVYLLYIPNLTPDNRQLFESSLIKIKGVVSFLIDIAVRRCTLRICPRVTIKEVVEKISGKCSMKCLVVRKNKDEMIESYYDVMQSTPNRSYLEYPEEEFLHKSGAVATATAVGKSKTGLLSSVVGFWKESFYW